MLTQLSEISGQSRQHVQQISQLAGGAFVESSDSEQLGVSVDIFSFMMDLKLKPRSHELYNAFNVS